MSYVDGYIVAVPVDRKEVYTKFASVAAAVLKDYGALQVVECWGDDVPDGKLTSFPMAVKCEANEVVVFSWIRWPSRAARDAGMKDAMEDARFKDMDMTAMPFDGKRMIFGGFEVIVDE